MRWILGIGYWLLFGYWNLGIGYFEIRNRLYVHLPNRARGICKQGEIRRVTSHHSIFRISLSRSCGGSSLSGSWASLRL
jgi:hypothetical protein